ncbi:acyl-CoA dehydrogenase family protein [Hoyosella subflava]|uniref:Acyl-CoA dehydrogenase domain protein n=1 Tax=Hoyosella subflava (strain DSM 45089 / JCM 17490 / NBRC 109087 / DQS3-9A1) TaxID=443218 RepID=F6EPN2_HOYSD|nr:acyl-CoA dehydrogenase family protein [Hoyosella subflava]AEF39465.1 Acyl-CoA dehydrogenase domain protein [Hoyosella subflava DQS3-9A1]
MDFTITEAQGDLAGLAKQVLSDWNTKHPDRPLGGFDRELWTAMCSAGLVDAALPNTVGGAGFGVLEQCSILTEIGRTCAPVPFLSSVAGAASVLAEFGTPEQIERWLIPVVRGTAILSPAIADAGDPAPFTAQRGQEGWTLAGSQTAILDGAFADAFLCEAETPDGRAIFCVPRTASGVTVSEQDVVDGADAAQLELEAVTVRDTEILAGAAPTWLRQRLTLGLCAQQLGTLEAALEMTSDYARTREQFGKPIGSFQAVRQRLADAYIDVEAVRLTLWQAAWQISAGEPAADAVATAKFWAAEAGHRVAHTAVHIHGGVGIDLDYPLHRYFVAAKRAEFAFGGATSQLRTLGTRLAEELV